MTVALPKLNCRPRPAGPYLTRCALALLVITQSHALLVSSPAAGETTGRGEVLPNLPASFEGVLPCADCPGIEYRLNLMPEQVFFLKMTYLDRGEDAVSADRGRWVLGGDERTLVLRGGREAPLFFHIDGPTRVTMLDTEAREIESSLNYSLEQLDAFGWFDVRTDLRGLYRYLADAALFRDCLTSQTWPVAQEEASREAEREYVRLRRVPGEELLLTGDGRIEMRPGADGTAARPTLILERVGGFWPREACGSPFNQASLENTLWGLTRLHDEPVVMENLDREPSLLLRAQDHRLTGSGGCNRLMGSYELDGEQIRFGEVASTRMLCPDGQDIETTFLTTLAQVRAWRISGQHLELSDGDGRLLARFEARYLR